VNAADGIGVVKSIPVNFGEQRIAQAAMGMEVEPTAAFALLRRPAWAQGGPSCQQSNAAGYTEESNDHTKGHSYFGGLPDYSGTCR